MMWNLSAAEPSGQWLALTSLQWQHHKPAAQTMRMRGCIGITWDPSQSHPAGLIFPFPQSLQFDCHSHGNPTATGTRIPGVSTETPSYAHFSVWITYWVLRLRASNPQFSGGTIHMPTSLPGYLTVIRHSSPLVVEYQIRTVDVASSITTVVQLQATLSQLITHCVLRSTQWDGKWVVTYLVWSMGWVHSVADVGYSCIMGPTVH